jgi:uncharacterized membrane protein
MSILPNTDLAGRVRWLLLGSLALNLFFVGAAGAVAFRYTSPVPLVHVARMNHKSGDWLNRVTATLPSFDAQVMRSELDADAQKVVAARANLRLSQEDLRNSLRADPFNPEAVRTAMAERRAARENFDLILHDMIAAAASKMSVVGRNKLADWPPAGENTVRR